MTAFVGKIVMAYEPTEHIAPVAPPPPPPAPIKESEVDALPAPVPAPVPPPPVEEMKKASEAAVEVEQMMIETGRVTLKVEFDTGKSVVKSEYYKEIQNVADFMKKNPDKKIIVEGHTDNIGNKKANFALSQRRADAVKNVLVSKFNIESSRIEAKGFGGSKPITSNASAEGRQQNRRVDAVMQ
jgi:OOP family OmpA-OmpF porin